MEGKPQETVTSDGKTILTQPSMLGLQPPKRLFENSTQILGSPSNSLPGLRTLGLNSPFSNLGESTMIGDYLQTK